MAEMDQLLSKDPRRYDYMFHKANSLRTLGRHREAAAVMDRAIEIVPGNPLYVFHKAKSLALMGQYEESIKLLEEIVKIRPESVYLQELQAVRKALG